MGCDSWYVIVAAGTTGTQWDVRWWPAAWAAHHTEHGSQLLRTCRQSELAAQLLCQLRSAQPTESVRSTQGPCCWLCADLSADVYHNHGGVAPCTVDPLENLEVVSSFREGTTCTPFAGVLCQYLYALDRRIDLVRRCCVSRDQGLLIRLPHQMYVGAVVLLNGTRCVL